jgi:hypothetical protein
MFIADNLPQQGWIVQAGLIIIDGISIIGFIVYFNDGFSPSSVLFSKKNSYRIDV